MFIDEASGFINLTYKVSLNISKTIEAKRKFEYILQSYVIQVLAYQGNNEAYKAKDFIAELEREK